MEIAKEYFEYLKRVKKYKKILAKLEENIKKEREARYKEASKEDASR